MTKQRYWKSLALQGGKIVSDYDKSQWTIGEWREVPAPVRECEGLNCCRNIVDAMGYVNMEALAEVEIDGKIIEGDDKITAQRMRILRAWRWEKKDSVAMAVYSAQLCLKHYEILYPNDSRPRQAIEAALRWLENPTEENKSAARAAMSAAWAAESAAWAAESAARAAMSAAWAAESAAWAAESAAWEAESAESAENIQKARATMKKKIHNWIVKRIPELQECDQ